MTNQAQAAEQTKTIRAIPHKRGGFILQGDDCEGAVYQALRMWMIRIRFSDSWSFSNAETAEKALASVEDKTGRKVVVEPPPPQPTMFRAKIDDYCRGYRDGLDMGYDEGLLVGFADGYAEGYDACEARKARKAKMGRLKSPQDLKNDIKTRMRKARSKHVRDLMGTLVPLQSDEYFHGFRQGAMVGFEHGFLDGEKDGRGEGYEACASGGDKLSIEEALLDLDEETCSETCSGFPPLIV